MRNAEEARFCFRNSCLEELHQRRLRMPHKPVRTMYDRRQHSDQDEGSRRFQALNLVPAWKSLSITHLTLANYYESGHLHRIAGRSLSDHIAAMEPLLERCRRFALAGSHRPCPDARLALSINRPPGGKSAGGCRKNEAAERKAPRFCVVRSRLAEYGQA
jgi:hypothetical protein